MTSALRFHCRSKVDAIILSGFAIACGLAVLAMPDPMPERGGHLALIFPPWMSSAEAMTKATMSGATLVGAGRYPFVVIVAADSARQARIAGAVMTLSAAGLGGCLKKPAETVS